MYLFPRLVGVFTYFSITILFFLLLVKCNKKNLGKILFVYTIILTIMGYFYVPAESADLSRIWSMMKDFSVNSLNDQIDFAFSTNIPLFHLFSYFISLTGIYSLLPAIASFVFYINSFYIIKDYSEKKNFSSLSIAMTVFVFMCFGQFVQVISGIRSMLAFSIIARCVYNEYINNKNILKDFVWYIIASMIHPAALALFLIHLLLTFILSNKFSRLKKFVSTLIIILILLIFGKDYVQEMVSSANSYLTEDSYSYIWEYIMAILYLILLLVVFSNLKSVYVDLVLLKKYVCCFILIVFVFIPVYSIFQRYTVFISILSSPFFMEVINNGQVENCVHKYSQNKLLQLVFLVSMFILILACSRGNLSGLKFFI